MKKKATPEQLVDWRIGHHIEAAAKMIADALNRIADQLERDHPLKAAEVDLRREHLLNVLESKDRADRAAERLLGIVTRSPSVHDLRDATEASERRGPDWVKDVLE